MSCRSAWSWIPAIRDACIKAAGPAVLISYPFTALIILALCV
ncbi:hypothetical protein SAMN04489743_1404 [Pseudarthrobacter equi]|uniref:Uncharacterized protein n=1 Tax=Pseudarthrobacter equi TaxID=728066 RepID=A0A1H1WPZ5_9MICC|nr:hypothetical protein SAMN04489743_1404 [Pseudarthrobacter equi]